MTKSVKISEQDLSRKDVALSLIKSFKEVKSVEGYKEDRRHINSEIASQLLKLNYHGQRNVKMDMVNTLTDAMITRRKYSPNNVIAISYNPDRPTDTSMIALLNGQHTLWAIIRSNTTWPLVVSLFPCRSKEEIENHYALFDRGRARNQVDVSRATGLEDAIRRKNLPSAALAALGSAAKLIRAHLIDAREGGRDKIGNARLIHEWIDEAATAYKLISPRAKSRGKEAAEISEIGKAVRKRLGSPLLLPVILVALRSHPDETEITITQILECADTESEADPFLRQVVDYIAGTSDDPRLVLRSSNGSDRRIASRNFIHLLVSLRDRARGNAVAESIEDILITSTPTISESEALWDILTEDRLDRSVASV